MKVITAVVNNPIFIEIQYHTLKKYFEGEYEFIVFNDAKDFPDFTNGNDVSIKSKIENVCSSLNIQCINIPNGQHTFNRCPAQRCADSMNYILQYQIEHPDEYLLLDSDMFLIDFFNPFKFSEYDCAIVLQTRNNNKIHYFWNGIYYFNMHKMKNIKYLDWNCCLGCDVGGMMQLWLAKQMNGNPFPNTDDIRWTDTQFTSNNIYFIKHLCSITWNISEVPHNLKNHKKLLNFLIRDIRNKDGKFFCEIYDNVFLHYRAGGNWMREGMDIHNTLTKMLKEALL